MELFEVANCVWIFAKLAIDVCQGFDDRNGVVFQAIGFLIVAFRSMEVFLRKANVSLSLPETGLIWLKVEGLANTFRSAG